MTLKERRVTLDQKRESFINLFRNHPNKSRFEIERLDPGNYRWLRTKDSEWFIEHAPPRLPGNAMNFRKNKE